MAIERHDASDLVFLAADDAAAVREAVFVMIRREAQLELRYFFQPFRCDRKHVGHFLFSQEQSVHPIDEIPLAMRSHAYQGHALVKDVV